MLFNSPEFFLFLIIAFVLYWFVFNKKLNVQNFLILSLSYVFYGWWKWEFLGLIIFSTAVDFLCGKMIYTAQSKKRKLFFLGLSLIVNLGLLFYFKYSNFFIESFNDLLINLGFNSNISTLNIILPIGISFYTFQTLSYSIDIFRGHLKPSDNIITFAAYVAFFPQLVAGPIERATNLIPQFTKTRVFDYRNAVEGSRQILWGLFKKVVIADNCGILVNEIFANYETLEGIPLVLGSILFAFQIYGDFSGYSDIAIGVAKLFGFNLMQNFAFPYFSRDIAEFWRRWHISLSSWFRDYIYIPLGGSQKGKFGTIVNIFIIFLVSGFWHGANWTFLMWGGLNACYFLPLYILGKNRKNLEFNKGSFFKGLEALKILKTFLLTCLAWIFFRSESISAAFLYIKRIFSTNFFNFQLIDNYSSELKILILWIFLLLVIEWINKEKLYALEDIQNLISNTACRWIFYMVFTTLILYYSGIGGEFIYFQF